MSRTGLWKTLDGLSLAVLELSVRAADSLRMPPYKGSTLRGGFGVAFKRIACPFRCVEACLAPAHCIYTYVFETPPPEGAEMMRKHPHAPHPFVIEPPAEDTREYAPGSALTFRLVLIGRATGLLAYFVYAFDELGRIGIGRGRGRFVLEEVRWVDPISRDCRVLYRGDDRKLAPLPGVLTGLTLAEQPPSPTRRVALHLQTPVRVVSEGQVTQGLPFHALFRALLRRVSLLSYFHCGRRLDLDFRGLAERSRTIQTAWAHLRWHDWARYSHRQDQRVPMGGLVGRVAYEGEGLEDLLPLLKLGQWVHVGKGTAFGLGRYRVEGANGHE